MVYIGTKYFKYYNDELEMIRILSYYNSDSVKFKNVKTKEEGVMTIDNLHDNYTQLNPDGYITFSIVQLSGNIEDVIVMLYKYKDIIKEPNSLPYCVCRQNITDIFANQIKINNTTYYGSCVSQDTCPIDVPLDIMMACDSVKETHMISVYSTDNLDNVLSFIKPKNYDAVIASLFYDHIKYESKYKGGEIFYKNTIKKDFYQGYCKTLKSLLETNNFMYDFYRAFDIMPLDLSLKESNELGYLTEDIIDILQKLLCKNITNTLICKYDKDIDLNKVDKDYVLLADNNNIVYLACFDTYGEYHIPVENVESEENIVNMASLKHSKSVKDAYSLLMMNKDKYK